MNPDDAYKPQLRLTVERKGFGGGSSFSQSYQGANPDEVGGCFIPGGSPFY